MMMRLFYTSFISIFALFLGSLKQFQIRTLLWSQSLFGYQRIYKTAEKCEDYSRIDLRLADKNINKKKNRKQFITYETYLRNLQTHLHYFPMESVSEFRHLSSPGRQLYAIIRSKNGTARVFRQMFTPSNSSSLFRRAG